MLFLQIEIMVIYNIKKICLPMNDRFILIAQIFKTLHDFSNFHSD